MAFYKYEKKARPWGDIENTTEAVEMNMYGKSKSNLHQAYSNAFTSFSDMSMLPYFDGDGKSQMIADYARQFKLHKEEIDKKARTFQEWKADKEAMNSAIVKSGDLTALFSGAGFDYQGANQFYDFNQKNNTADSMKNGLEFNTRLAINIERTKDMLKMQGYNEEEMNEYFKPPAMQYGPKIEETLDRLSEIEKGLKKGKEGKLYAIREGSLNRQVQNMISNESFRELNGLSSSREVIENWLEKHPEIQPSNDTLLYYGLRGIGDIGTTITGNVKDALQDDATKWIMGTACVLGAGAAIYFSGGLALPFIGASSIAGGGALTTASIASGSPILASAGSGMLAPITTGTLLSSLSLGARASTTKQMWDKMSGENYVEFVNQGIEPNIARTMAMTVGAAQSLLEVAQLETAVFSKIPGVKKQVDRLKRDALRSAVKYMGQVAFTYGKELATETIEEVGQEYVKNLGLGLSKEIQGGKNIFDAMMSNEQVNPFNAKELYFDVASQSAKSLWLLPLLGQGMRTADYVHSRKTGLADTMSEADRKYYSSAKNFALNGGIQKLYDFAKDKKATQSDKFNIAKDALTNSTIISNVKKFKVGMFNDEEKVKLEKLQNESIKVAEEYINETKKSNPDLYIPDSDIESIRNRMVESVVSGHLNTYTDMQSFMGFDKVTAENYQKVSEMKGVADTIRTLRAEGKKPIQIAESIKNSLPRKQRNIQKAVLYTNSVIKVDDEAKLQVLKTKMKAIDESRQARGVSKEIEVADVKPMTEEKERFKEKLDNDDSNELEPIDNNPVIPETNFEKVDVDKVNGYKKADVYEINTSDIKVDPQRFQFRAKGTDKIKYSKTEYNDNLAGVMHLYKDTDGSLYALDGHHRLELAKENGVERVKAQIIDSEDMSVSEARVLGAMINIAEDHATGIDVAKLIKNGEIDKSDLKKFNIRPNSNIAINGSLLASLDENLFNKVLINALSEDRGAEIAKAFPNDTAKQMQLYKMIERADEAGKVIDTNKIKWFTSAIRGSMEESVENNFLGDFLVKNYTYEKADLMSYFESDIKRKRNLLSKISKNKNAEILSSLDNVINFKNNQEFIEDSEYVMNSVVNAFKKGNYHLDELLLDYAKKLQDNPHNNHLKGEFTRKIIDLVDNGDIDIFGMSKEDNKVQEKAMYQLEKADLPNVNRLFDDVVGNRVFKYDGDINVNLADKLNNDGKMTIFVNSRTNDTVYKDLGVPIQKLSSNSYFNDVAVIFNGKDDVKFFSEEELNNAGYKGYEAGEYTIKGYSQKINGNSTKGIQGVVLSNGADKTTVLEEVIHAILDKERSNNTELFSKIEDWSKGVQEKADQLGIDIPNNDELFAQAFVYTEGGFAKNDNMMSNLLGIDDTLVSDIKNILGDDFIKSCFGDNYPKEVKYNKPLYYKLDVDRGILTDEKDIAMANMNLNTKSEAFEKWFGDSKVVDFKGEPLVVYGRGFRLENEFTDVNNGKNQEVYLRITNPITIPKTEEFSIKELISQGYDGIIRTGEDSNSYVIFNDNQFKSVYDNGEIHYSLGEVTADDMKATYETKMSSLIKRLEGKVSDEMYSTILENYGEYKVEHNIENILASAELIAEHGEDDVFNYLMNKDIENVNENITAMLLAESFGKADDSRQLDLIGKLQKSATNAGQLIQSFKLIDKLDSNGLIKYAQKLYDENIDDNVKARIKEKARNLENSIKQMNRNAVSEIDFKSLVNGISSMSDGELNLEVLKDSLSSEELESLVNADNEVVVDRSITSENIDNRIVDVQKAVQKSYDKDINLNKELIKRGFSQEEATVIAKSVVNEINSLTADGKADLFKAIDKKKRGMWENALSKLGDNSKISKTALEGEVAFTEGVAGVSHQIMDMLNQKSDVLKTMGDGYEKNVEIAELFNELSKYEYVPVGRKIATYQTMSMLLNFRTMIKNIGGNSAFGTLDSMVTNFITAPIDVIVGLKTGKRSHIVRNPLSIASNSFKGAKLGLETGVSEALKGIDTGDYTSWFDGMASNVYDNKLKITEAISKMDNSEFESTLKDVINKNKHEQMDMGLGNKFDGNEQNGVIVKNANGTYKTMKVRNTFKTGVLSKMEKALSVGLQATDRAAMMATIVDSVDEQIQILNKEGRTLTPEIEVQIKEQAILDGLYRTFNDDTKLAQVTTGIKRLLNKAGIQGEFGLGDALLKFPKTPANILMRGFDYSPLGFIGGIRDIYSAFSNDDYLAQKRGVEKLGRATAGSGIIGLSILLASAGIITPAREDDDDSEKVKGIKSDNGFINSSFNFSKFRRWVFGGFQEVQDEEGDVYLDYTWNQPIAIAVGIGSSIYEASKGNANALSNGMAAIVAGINSLADQPLLRGLTESFKYSNSVADGIATALTNVPASFVPSIVNQIGQFIDPTSRVTKGDGYVETTINKVKYRIPILRESLEPRLTPWGEEKTYRSEDTSDLGHFYNTFFAISNKSKNKSDPVNDYLLALKKETGSSDAIPPVLKNSFKSGGKTYTLPSEAFVEVSKARGQEMYEAYSEAIKYQGTDMEENEKELSSLRKQIDKKYKMLVIDILENNYYQESEDTEDAI